MMACYIGVCDMRFPCIPCGMPKADIIDVPPPRRHIALVAPSVRTGTSSIMPLSGIMLVAVEVAKVYTIAFPLHGEHRCSE